jgi:hypothetical protein
VDPQLSGPPVLFLYSLGSCARQTSQRGLPIAGAGRFQSLLARPSVLGGRTMAGASTQLCRAGLGNVTQLSDSSVRVRTAKQLALARRDGLLLMRRGRWGSGSRLGAAPGEVWLMISHTAGAARATVPGVTSSRAEPMMGRPKALGSDDGLWFVAGHLIVAVRVS